MVIARRPVLGWICGGLFIGGAFQVAHAAGDGAQLSNSNIDVAGIRLQMTTEQAIEAVKSFDKGIIVVKDYLKQGKPFTDTQGMPLQYLEAGLSDHDKGKSYFNDITALKPLPGSDCRTPQPDQQSGNGAYCGFGTRLAERINIWFTPVVGAERVIAVQRQVAFPDGAAPAMAAIEKGLFSKYPIDAATLSSKGKTRDGAIVQTADWIFDGKGALLKQAQASGRGFSSANGGTPKTVRPGDGVWLSVTLTSAADNNGLASGISITLSDSSAQFASLAQSKATISQILNAANNAEAQSARPPAIKY